MDCYPLDITLISADGLKNVNNFTKMDVYVVVSINGDPSTARKSPVDKDAGTNPRWNHHFRFELDEYTIKHRSLLFVIKSDRALGDRDIGEVSVPISDLPISDLFDKSTVAAVTTKSDDKDDAAAAAASPKIQPEDRVVEYDVRTTSGKSKGVLKFAYKFGEKYTRQIAAPPPAAAAKGYGNFNEPVTAYPAAGPSTQPGMMYPGVAAGPYPHPGYAQPPPHGYGGYPTPPPQGYAGYPPQGGYPGYPPAGYPPYGGYQQAPPPQYAQQPHKKKMGGGSKLGLGLGAGLLGGLLVGDMIGDIGEMAAYDSGYDAGFGDGGDFDF